MRRVRVLATAAVLPVLVTAACSGRSNDLYTYYDPTTTSSAPESTPPAPVTTSQAPTTTTTTSRPDPTPLALTAADLVAEEVQPDGAQPLAAVQLVECGLAVATGPTVRTRWKYGSGSVLTQQVVTLSAEAAPEVDGLKAARCATFTTDGQRYQVDTGPVVTVTGVDAQFGVCSASPKRALCTVVAAKGATATAVTVEAATPARARTALARLAPLAVAKLS